MSFVLPMVIFAIATILTTEGQPPVKEIFVITGLLSLIAVAVSLIIRWLLGVSGVFPVTRH